MTKDQIDRLKRMAVNAGGMEDTWFVDTPMHEENNPLGVFFDDAALARFTQAVAEDCAKAADDSPDLYIADRIRNLYKDQA